MSNSIWKTPDINPENYQSIMFITKNKSTRAGVFKDGFYYDDANNQYEDDELECWATIYDVKAQADKAERLQKAVDNSREKLAAFMHDAWGNWFAYQLNNSTVENLQRWGIQSNTPYSSLTETDKDKDRKFADHIIEIIKDEIKQLIKGE